MGNIRKSCLWAGLILAASAHAHACPKMTNKKIYSMSFTQLSPMIKACGHEAEAANAAGDFAKAGQLTRMRNHYLTLILEREEGLPERAGQICGNGKGQEQFFHDALGWPCPR